MLTVAAMLVGSNCSMLLLNTIQMKLNGTLSATNSQAGNKGGCGLKLWFVGLHFVCSQQPAASASVRQCVSASVRQCVGAYYR